MADRAAVIGGGPAGLMAAEVLADAGVRVDVFDAMPSVGRKFLLAGIGGMNITHAEEFGHFVSRYRERAPQLLPILEAFSPAALREWIHALGIETFVGSSGRVFPREMKAAPLLRRWLHRLRECGVTIHTRHSWQGWNENDELLFETQHGAVALSPDVTVLALGGASWPRLGSDARWVPWLRARNVTIAPLRPANSGFDLAWSEHLRQRHAGEPVKNVTLSVRGVDDVTHERRGEFVLTETGIEGSLVYALSAELRERLACDGTVNVSIDLLPDRSVEQVRELLGRAPKGRSTAETLRRQLRLRGVKAALLREGDFDDFGNFELLAERIKSLPLTLTGMRSIDEAISTAGGVAFESCDEHLMLKGIPGVFVAGEMLDWEAPTGGYLLTACLATGRAAGEGALRRLLND